MDKWLSNHNIIRVVAVMVGILLWVIVRLDVQNSNGPSQPTTISQTYTNVEVDVVGLDEERFTLVSYEPSKVSLTVVGTGAALRRVDTDDYRVLLNLTDVQPGEQLVSLTYEGFPNNVDVVLDPPNVAVTIDEKERKELPVTIQISGQPAEGFVAGEPVVEPNRAHVTVDSSLAGEVASVAGVLDIGGATETVRRQVKLVALSQDGTELDLPVSPAVAEVEVPVTIPFKTVPLQMMPTDRAPPGVAVGAIEPNISEVTVYAPQSVLDTIEFYIGPNIDLSELAETQTFDVELLPPQGAERIEPSSVSVTVTVEPAVRSEQDAVALTLEGRHDAYEYRIASPESGQVDVAVEAAQARIDELEAGDVSAIVDVGNLPPGEHEVPIEYRLPPFVELAEGNTRIVTVVVTAPADEETSAEPEPSEETDPPAGDGGSPPADTEDEEAADDAAADGEPVGEANGGDGPVSAGGGANGASEGAEGAADRPGDI